MARSLLPMVGLVLTGLTAACLPEFPERDLSPGADAGGKPDGSLDAGDGGAGSCSETLQCSSPEHCAQGHCTASCTRDEGCERKGVYCYEGQCKPLCRSDPECPEERYCLDGRCTTYCSLQDDNCPDDRSCGTVNPSVRLCLCSGTSDCPDELVCIEGRCIPECSALGDTCAGEPGRVCDDTLGVRRCFPKGCSSLVDPTCGGQVTDSCFGADDTAEPARQGYCTRRCTTGLAKGDGDDCGPGFRCTEISLALGSIVLPFCLPVGNTRLGEHCDAVSNNYSPFCLAGWCFDEKCTVLCRPGSGADGYCREMLGVGWVCRQVISGQEWGWACIPRRV